MMLKEVIQKSLDELKDIAKIDAALFFKDGSYYAGVIEKDDKLAAALDYFGSSMAAFQELGGYYLYRLEEEEEYILAVKENRADAAVIGRLAVAQIKNLIYINQEKSSRENFLKSLLEGKLSAEKISLKSEKFHLHFKGKKAVFLIELERGKEEGVFEIIQNIGETPQEDIIFKMEENIIALVKTIESDDCEEEQRNIANTLVDMINVEAMEKVRISYGTPVTELIELSNSYREALTALEVGKIFYADKKTISFRKLGIGRLLYQLPKELCEKFLNEVLGMKLEEVLDPETLGTIYRFFDNGLNVSETARQLYVHRNTLVYRLEKIQKQLGLDIRQFDDAVTFKIALMVTSYLKFLVLKS